MGVLPLQHEPGENAHLLGLTGQERFTIRGLDTLKPGQIVDVEAVGPDGAVKKFSVRARVDNDTEIRYLHNGGILPLVLRELIARN
jgi:aconitate hydratase